MVKSALNAPRLIRWAVPLLLLTGTSFPLLGEEFAKAPDAAWGGPDCTPRATLRAAVDVAFEASPAGDFFENGRGSGAPGYSVALAKPGCGLFRYAVGHRDVERGRLMTIRTRQHLGSLTKALTAAIILPLADIGFFGPEGLDASLDRFFTEQEIQLLTQGSDPENPLCPAPVLTINRSSGVSEVVVGQCPDFSQITLRHLSQSNHGMFDFINEVDRNFNGVSDNNEFIISSLLDALGIPHFEIPATATKPFDLLAAHGLLSHPEASLGGNGLKDFETSFGNTGYTLLGLVAERTTGLPYNFLLRILVNGPLPSVSMRSLNAPPRREGRIARPYSITSGADFFGLPEDSLGVYPPVDISGNPATNTYELDSFLATNSGGAGAVVATPSGYRLFIESLLDGSLLNPGEQELFEGGFVPVEGLPGVHHGFGLFKFDDPEFGPGYAKSGQTTGSGCQVLRFLESGITTVVCRNSADAFLGRSFPPSAAPVGDLARELVRLAGP